MGVKRINGMFWNVQSSIIWHRRYVGVYVFVSPLACIVLQFNNISGVKKAQLWMNRLAGWLA